MKTEKKEYDIFEDFLWAENEFGDRIYKKFWSRNIGTGKITFTYFCLKDSKEAHDAPNKLKKYFNDKRGFKTKWTTNHKEKK